MASKAKVSKGTLLKRGDGGGSEVFTTIGEVLSFSGPKRSAAVIDVTSFDSAAKEKIGGLPDFGEVTFDVNFVGSDAQQQGLDTDWQNQTLRNFKLELADHATTKTTYNFSALVTNFDGPTAGQDEQYKASITLTISGAATRTYAPA